ncbi:hypothetical protein V6N13_103015 [Hibiscus sabdariffa]
MKLAMLFNIRFFWKDEDKTTKGAREGSSLSVQGLFGVSLISISAIWKEIKVREDKVSWDKTRDHLFLLYDFSRHVWEAVLHACLVHRLVGVVFVMQLVKEEIFVGFDP